MDKARNDLSAAVPKFCLALEEHRRTTEGRVRTSQEMLATFFPHDDKTSTDRILKYLPNDVRGPIVAAWGIRGIKAALRDTDDKVQSVVFDALVAGDIDHVAFENGLAPETLVRWVPLSDWWAFWRGGKLTKQAIHKALSTAYELYLFDARWFLDTIQGKGGSIKGTDVLADGLTKEDLTGWIRRIHETGDGSPKGIVSALGWDKVVGKTANDVLIAVLDAMVAKVGLVTSSPRESSSRTEQTAKIEASPEPGPAIADDASHQRVLEALDKADDWSAPLLPDGQGAHGPEGSHAAPPPSEEAIHIVLEEEIAPSSSAPETPPSVLLAPPRAEVESSPPYKALRERFPFRPGNKR
ncbi:MAG: hypothetical protein FWD17_07460 [Polyangiaceae bacterium]|nr:hypothetical protein [Polyangiaceae bacterium]